MQILMLNPTRAYSEREWTWQSDLFEMQSMLEHADHEVRYAYNPGLVKTKHYDMLIVFCDNFREDYSDIPIVKQTLIDSVNLIKKFQSEGKSVGLYNIDTLNEFTTYGDFIGDDNYKWSPDFLIGKTLSQQWIDRMVPKFKNLPWLKTDEAYEEIYLTDKYNAEMPLPEDNEYEYDFSYGGAYHADRIQLLNTFVKPLIDNPKIKTMIYGQVAQTEKFYKDAKNNELIHFIEPSKIFPYINKSKFDIVISKHPYDYDNDNMTPRKVQSLLSNAMTLFLDGTQPKGVDEEWVFHDYDELMDKIKYYNANEMERFTMTNSQYNFVMDKDLNRDYYWLNEFLNEVR